ncbi:MAG: hypothetical protein BWY11_00747 [Firmicutes bacterium ADurb.Bin182]|nr:MAG: hypothetical protein BWY11_00747 [Firmicutes bacterium ADurb.Bin182]
MKRNCGKSLIRKEMAALTGSRHKPVTFGRTPCKHDCGGPVINIFYGLSNEHKKAVRSDAGGYFRHPCRQGMLYCDE